MQNMKGLSQRVNDVAFVQTSDPPSGFTTDNSYDVVLAIVSQPRGQVHVPARTGLLHLVQEIILKLMAS